MPDGKECNRCIIMDISPVGVGLLIASAQPITEAMKLFVEFPVQCQTSRAEIALRWSRPLSTTSAYNWAAGGLWADIGESDKMMLLNSAVEDFSFGKIREDLQQDTVS
ncbi:MAG: hypothetical protein N3B18_06435 [Desulfobacterota bacterium]|nr:hypothetical protein [Thermodesulfobacteriota bacterium]